MSHNHTLNKRIKPLVNPYNGRKMPQISCTIESEDLAYLKDVLLEMTNLHGEKFTISEIIRLMIRYAKNHPSELCHILEVS